jgi:hypothetical protein
MSVPQEMTTLEGSTYTPGVATQFGTGELGYTSSPAAGFTPLTGLSGFAPLVGFNYPSTQAPVPANAPAVTPPIGPAAIVAPQAVNPPTAPSVTPIDPSTAFGAGPGSEITLGTAGPQGTTTSVPGVPGTTTASTADSKGIFPSFSSWIGSAGLTIGIVMLGIALLLFAVWPHASTIVSVAKGAGEATA